MKSPEEVAPTPAPIGIVPPPPKPPEVLGQHSPGSTVLQAAASRPSRRGASALRNRIVTYATMMGREARAAGLNGCFDDPEASRRFEASSLRNALRRLKPRRKGASQDEMPVEEPKDGQPGGALLAEIEPGSSGYGSTRRRRFHGVGGGSTQVQTSEKRQT